MKPVSLLSANVGMPSWAPLAARTDKPRSIEAIREMLAEVRGFMSSRSDAKVQFLREEKDDELK